MRSSCCRCSPAAASRSPRPRRSGSRPRRSRSSTGGVDVFAQSTFVAGLAAAFLLGNLRDAVQAWLGLAIAVGSVTIVVYNNPAARCRRARLHPGPVRDRLARAASRSASGPSRPRRPRRARRVAEREREPAARIAVAEERARIARELHDIVAHAVSVMVLQVGAVRHKLPDALAEDARRARATSSRPGRTALAEMRRLLGAMRRDGDDLELAPQPGLDSLDSLLEEVGRAGLPVSLHVDGEPVAAPARDRPLRVSHRPGGPDQRAQARARQPRRRDRPLRAGRGADRGARRRRGRRERATASGTGSSASASA